MVHLLLAVIYLAFISLGLPDSLLGSAWPSMQPEFGVPVSYAGIISMIIALGTVVSSLQSDRLTRKLGAGLVTALSVLLTALALLGFSLSRSFWALCLLAIPYGLGAGSVDAALNNYVALNYASRHMSWLHCMWGVGTTVGPYIMEYALTGGYGWNMGYRYIAILQFFLTLIIFCSLPLWKKRVSQTQTADDAADAGRALSLKEIVRIPGAKERDDRLLLLLRRGIDGNALGEQLPGAGARRGNGSRRRLCQSFLHWHHRGTGAERLFDHALCRRADDPHGAGAGGAGRGDAAAAAGNGGGACRTGGDRAGLRAHLSLHHPFHAGTLRRGEFAGAHRRADGQRLCGHAGRCRRCSG